MTKYLDQYRVFGNPIAHSKSPLIHRMFAEQTAQALDYQIALAPLDGFADAVRQFMDESGKGANVTVPFKLEAFALCDRLTERARFAGAVNTLYFRDGVIEGDNTDGAGLIRDIVVNADFPIRGKRVLLLGAGGASRGALQPLLMQEPKELVIANRTVAKAEELVQLASSLTLVQTRCVAASWEQIVGQFDLVINATSSSLQGEVLPISKAVFAENCLAYDMMYGAQLTPFLNFAQQAGAQVRDGLGMLIEQAAEAFDWWRGVRPETAHVFKQLREGAIG